MHKGRIQENDGSGRHGEGHRAVQAVQSKGGQRGRPQRRVREQADVTGHRQPARLRPGAPAEGARDGPEAAADVHVRRGLRHRVEEHRHLPGVLQAGHQGADGGLQRLHLRIRPDGLWQDIHDEWRQEQPRLHPERIPVPVRPDSAVPGGEEGPDPVPRAGVLHRDLQRAHPRSDNEPEQPAAARAPGPRRGDPGRVAAHRGERRGAADAAGARLQLAVGGGDEDERDVVALALNLHGAHGVSRDNQQQGDDPRRAAESGRFGGLRAPVENGGDRGPPDGGELDQSVADDAGHRHSEACGRFVAHPVPRFGADALVAELAGRELEDADGGEREPREHELRRDYVDAALRGPGEKDKEHAQDQRRPEGRADPRDARPHQDTRGAAAGSDERRHHLRCERRADPERHAADAEHEEPGRGARGGDRRDRGGLRPGGGGEAARAARAEEAARRAPQGAGRVDLCRQDHHQRHALSAEGPKERGDLRQAPRGREPGPRAAVTRDADQAGGEEGEGGEAAAGPDTAATARRGDEEDLPERQGGGGELQGQDRQDQAGDHAGRAGHRGDSEQPARLRGRHREPVQGEHQDVGSEAVPDRPVRPRRGGQEGRALLRLQRAEQPVRGHSGKAVQRLHRGRAGRQGAVPAGQRRARLRERREAGRSAAGDGRAARQVRVMRPQPLSRNHSISQQKRLARRRSICRLGSRCPVPPRSFRRRKALSAPEMNEKMGKMSFFWLRSSVEMAESWFAMCWRRSIFEIPITSIISIILTKRRAELRDGRARDKNVEVQRGQDLPRGRPQAPWRDAELLDEQPLERANVVQEGRGDQQQRGDVVLRQDDALDHAAVVHRYQQYLGAEVRLDRAQRLREPVRLQLVAADEPADFHADLLLPVGCLRLQRQPQRPRGPARN